MSNYPQAFQVRVGQQNLSSHILFSEKEIQKRVVELSHEINRDYSNSVNNPLVILIVLNGAFIFAADLIRNLNVPTEIETIHFKSYEGTQSTNKINLISSLPNNLADKDILIVEDIVETGRSLNFLYTELQKANVKSAKICTLLNKPECHEAPIPVHYTGFTIGKDFVIGYGLDLDGKFRNLPYIAQLKQAD